jgi:hypothetical protein
VILRVHGETNSRKKAQKTQKKEFEEFTELQEFQKRSQEPESKSQEVMGLPYAGAW